MGKGKKKNKPGNVEKMEVNPSDSQPSTSQAQPPKGEESTQAVETMSEASKIDSPAHKISEMDEEVVGLGLGGPSKKRTRKKKKDTGPAVQAVLSTSPTETKDDDNDDDSLTEQMSGLTASGPSEAFLKLSTGFGRGTGRGAPPPPQTQVQPIPSAAQQRTALQQQVQSAPAWGKKPQQPIQSPPQQVTPQSPPPQQVTPQSPPPQQVTSHSPPPQQVAPQFPSPQGQPQQPPPEMFSRPQMTGYGRGRGQVWSKPVVAPEATPLQSVLPQETTQPGPSGRGRREPQKKIEVVGRPPSTAPQSSGASVCRYKIPDKSPPGIVTKRSRPIRLVTNYLEMRIKPVKIFRYDVSVKPDRPKKLAPKAFTVVKEKHFPKHIVAFDQRKNCYSLTKLWNTPNDRINVNVEIKDDNNEKISFEVIIIATGVVDIGTIVDHMKNGGSSLNPPTEAIQCIDVILQQGTLENYVRVGRQYFMRPKNPIDLWYGMEMWNGLFQSAIFTSRPFINIDVAHKAFPRQQPLIDAIVKDFRLDPKRPLERQRGFDYFMDFIKGLKVTARLGGGERSRDFICNGIGDPPGQIYFDAIDPAGNKTKTNVLKYFEVDKRCRLKYPNLNCMWVGPRDRGIYYPIELLEVTYGQPFNKQLNEKQLQIMVSEAATAPDIRLNKIKDVIHNMNYSANACFKHFNLEVSNKFFQVDAKVLQPPKLDTGEGRPVEPRRGVWIANRFLRASPLDSWALISIEVDPNACRCSGIIDMVKRVGGQMGMLVRDPLMTNFNVRMHEINKILNGAYDKGVNMLFVVVPGRYKDAYEKVKRQAELEVGILTQCIKENTATRRMNDQTVRNILLKVNSKLMGINQALEARSLPECIKNGSAMMVGADVTHPSPDQRSIPSIAAVTASIDAKCFTYNIELSMQPPKAEIIVDFEEMMFDHLQIYKSRMNSLPRKIYVFRDGVSEGQFSQVMNSELAAVQKAYYRLEQRVKPEILFLLVQKRHHTRFFLGETNTQNVEPGTVVDSEIVHPRELDFYLVSHQAIKGTARPTRYHVVCNDGKIPSDEVEQLAYYLCHMYSRCSRAVSYPAPTYYAHLACLRARTLTAGDRVDFDELDRKPKRIRVLDKMLRYSRMFFV